LKGTVSIFARLPAGSIALVKFGLDSLVESLSGITMVWRFIKHGRISQEEEEKVERKVTIIVAAVSLVIMPILFYMKRQTGKSIRSRSLTADVKKNTRLCVSVCRFIVGIGTKLIVRLLASRFHYRILCSRVPCPGKPWPLRRVSPDFLANYLTW